MNSVCGKVRALRKRLLRRTTGGCQGVSFISGSNILFPQNIKWFGYQIIEG
jgi:hypothetical protein